jgi:hypothetical protein
LGAQLPVPQLEHLLTGLPLTGRAFKYVTVAVITDAVHPATALGQL